MAANKTEQLMAVANRTVMRPIQKRLEKDASSDISGLLEHAINVYNGMRKDMIEQAENAKPKPSLATITEDAGAATKSSDPRISMQIKGTARIRKSLHAELQSLLSNVEPTGTATIESIDEDLSEEVTSRINDLIAASEVIWELGKLAVLGLNSSVVLKVGSAIDLGHLTELETIQAHAPSLPMPTTLGVITTVTLTYHFMSRVEGEPLDKSWPTLSTDQKTAIHDQLVDIFTQLRQIPFTPDREGKLSFGGGHPRRCTDMRRERRTTTDPIYDEPSFANFIVPVVDQDGKSLDSPHRTMLRSFLGQGHKIVLSHSDLHPRNIMVQFSPAAAAAASATHDDDGGGSGSGSDEPYSTLPKISGVIDWELCGWYPAYWEFIKALHTVSEREGTSDWWRYLPTEAIGDWGAQYALDIMISRSVH